MPRLTLMDIAKMNNADRLTGIFDDEAKAHPEIMIMPARTINGSSYETLHRTGVQMATFTDANEGRDPGKNSYANKLVQTKNIDASVEIAQHVADAHEDGAAAVLAQEAAGMIEGAWRAITSQMYYGTATTVATSEAGNPTKGFPGFIETVDPSMVVDATGSGSARTSVWGVCFGPRAVTWVFGNNGKLMTRDPELVRLTDANGRPLPGYWMPLTGRVGLQLVHPFAIGRVKNITTSAVLTSGLLAKLLAKYPVGLRPDAWFMTRAALEMYRLSLATALIPEPATPTMAHGIPIYPTDSIKDTEAA